MPDLEIKSNPDAPFVQCYTCRRERYPNQLVPVQGRTEEGEPKLYNLCPECEGELNFRIGNKDVLAGLIRGRVLSAGEIDRIRKERSHEYAIAGYPAHKQITHLEEGVS